MAEGGGLFTISNEFSMLEDYQRIGIPDALNDLFKAKANLEGNEFKPITFEGDPPSLAAMMQSNYKGSVDLSTIITDNSIADIDTNVNIDGQVKFFDSVVHPEEFLTYPFYPFNLALIEFLTSVSDYRVELSGGSVM